MHFIDANATYSHKKFNSLFRERVNVFILMCSHATRLAKLPDGLH